eukprot:scaffold154_cov129-Cylindrotheca_fusiformis.AAC.8
MQIAESSSENTPFSSILQARFQLGMLASVTECRKVLLWGRTTPKSRALSTRNVENRMGHFIAKTPDYLMSVMDYRKWATYYLHWSRCPWKGGIGVQPCRQGRLVGGGHDSAECRARLRKENDDRITMFDSSGVALQDCVVAAQVVYDAMNS